MKVKWSKIFRRQTFELPLWRKQATILNAPLAASLAATILNAAQVSWSNQTIQNDDTSSILKMTMMTNLNIIKIIKLSNTRNQFQVFSWFCVPPCILPKIVRPREITRRKKTWSLILFIERFHVLIKWKSFYTLMKWYAK